MFPDDFSASTTHTSIMAKTTIQSTPARSPIFTPERWMISFIILSLVYSAGIYLNSINVSSPSLPSSSIHSYFHPGPLLCPRTRETPFSSLEQHPILSICPSRKYNSHYPIAPDSARPRSSGSIHLHRFPGSTRMGIQYCRRCNGEHVCHSRQYHRVRPPLHCSHG